MSKKMKITIEILVVVAIFLLVLLGMKYIYVFDSNSENVSQLELKMVEKYLYNKYNIKLKVMDYNYTNYDIGYNGGIHYIFYFESVEGFELSASLDYLPLQRENLKYISLNITNIEKAQELKEYIKENSGLDCQIQVFRITDEKYYTFRVILDNNSNYWLMGEIYKDDNLENIKIIGMSDSIKKITGLSNNDINSTDFISILEIIRKYL